MYKLLAYATLVALLGTLVSCGGGGSGSSSNGLTSAQGTTPAVVISTLTPLPSITDPVISAEVVFVNGQPGDCYPGLAIQLHAYQAITSDKYMGQVITADVTSSASWTSDAPSVATVSNAGLVTCVAAGRAMIHAPYQGATSGGAIINVGDAQHVLTISPASASVAVGQTLTFTIILTTNTPSSPATTQDVSGTLAGLSVLAGDSLNGNGSVIVHTTGNNNVFMASKAGTAWGSATYTLSSGVGVQSNLFTITVH